MNDPHSAQWIVVGIDGSEAAISAARWAVAEATSRDLPLRLVYAIPDASLLDVECGEAALRTAYAALHAVTAEVKIETDLVRGSAADVLVGQSRHAAMVCAGSVGIGPIARLVIGSTAQTVAQKALCPVAVVRAKRDACEPHSGSVAVVVDDSPHNDAVLDHGFREARLREAPILAMGVWRWGLGEIPYRQLDRRLHRWVTRYPEVHVRPAAARRGAVEYLSGAHEPVQLAVVDSRYADRVAQLVGPPTPRIGYAGCSVLVVR
ncbi:universal stress protein [Mycobacterium sp. 94-17]|uniref:universal stress protein n=1 Tax=Mycobacterium sp. 94-17 TaxID=2986147 RepID=UPI002D1F4E92|nr:universal stress protein [Mycobacterium sp. 94-17]MEB4212231.1 universal stress protein [Mycobacterium sp. 94-17]